MRLSSPFLLGASSLRAADSDLEEIKEDNTEQELMAVTTNNGKSQDQQNILKAQLFISSETNPNFKDIIRITSW